MHNSFDYLESRPHPGHQICRLAIGGWYWVWCNTCRKDIRWLL